MLYAHLCTEAQSKGINDKKNQNIRISASVCECKIKQELKKILE